MRIAEEWVTCPAYPLYEVNRSGDVRRVDTKMVKKVFFDPKGYPLVWLAGLFSRGPVRVAQLVMHSFCDQIPPKRFVIRYRDRNRKNTHFENLYYQAAADMVKDTWSRGQYAGKVTGRPFASGPGNPRYNPQNHTKENQNG